ncbi:MAG: lipoyl(octanoyl) transferase LipB [Dehalococcoidia bacterium]|nr:lipoyl(octanoyl) transferase LipB [Dehalococcoidia bacterium]
MDHPSHDQNEPSSDTRRVHVYELGTTGYVEVHALQQRLQSQRRDGGGVDSLLLTEHRPVITLGRSHPTPDLRVAPAVVQSYGMQIVQTERGGDITYHGPGQLVAYGIVDLKEWHCSVLDYVAGLEETVVGVLGDWGIRGERRERARGVWVGRRKIASLGLNVRRWVTMHGVALNVEPDMSHFDLINPCGMADVEMTSLSHEVGKHVPLDQVAESFVFHFARVFECETEAVDLNTRLTRVADQAG